MNKNQLHSLLPQEKNDSERAHSLALLEYSALKPVVPQMLRWLRTHPSPVADIFIAFLIRHSAEASEDVSEALRSSRTFQMKYVFVTQVLPEWPREAISVVADSLQTLMTDSGEPETALMALRLLAKHDLGDSEALRGWLDFITARMERNLGEARSIAQAYFR